MDPSAALRRLLDAIAERDEAEIICAAADLAQWFARGGFSPDLRTVLATYLDQTSGTPTT